MLIDTDTQNCGTCQAWSRVEKDGRPIVATSELRKLCLVLDGVGYFAACYTPANFSCSEWVQQGHCQSEP